MSTSTSLAFWSGAIAACSAMSLFQDYLGLYGYIAHVWFYWSSSWTTVPMAIGGMFSAGLLFAYAELRRYSGR
jgi:hypothetical protein